VNRAAAALAIAAALITIAAAGRPAARSEQVICVLCGDYTFDATDATAAVYEGEKIWLCSPRELEMLRASPDDYVWATDPVGGGRVHKIRTRFTTDRRVRVRKQDGTVEVWPRRFFFGSEKTRAEFLRAPNRYLKEPYSG